MSSINILIYEPYIFNVYGNTRYLLSIFKYIRSERYRLILCAPYEHEFLDKIRALGGRCLIVDTNELLRRFGGEILADSYVGKIKMCIALLQNAKKLRKIILSEGIDIVQCHSIRSLLTIGFSARAVRKPCFWYVKGELANKFLDTIGFFLANKIVFQSELNRDRRYPLLRAIFRSKIEINRNGIDLREIMEISDSEQMRIKEELELHGDELKIAAIGQISPLKGTDLLINALIELKERIPPFKLFLVGDHVLEKYDAFVSTLHSKIEQHGLRGKIIFTGWRPDATTILSCMDMLVHPSLTEGVPKAVIEGMSLGLPVILTDVGGAAELVRDSNNGILIKPNSLVDLVSAMEKLCHDHTQRKRMGAEGKRLAFSSYSIEDNIRRLEGLYDRLKDTDGSR